MRSFTYLSVHGQCNEQESLVALNTSFLNTFTEFNR